MLERLRIIAIAGLIACAAPLAPASAAETRLPVASAAAVGGKTLMPYGWHDFCGRQPQECHVGSRAPADIKMTGETWALLNRINAFANHAIKPISNLDHWGTSVDHWDYPVDGKGDCKIYALYKRKMLMQAGLPRQALLMTIVYDLRGEGHTILMARTDHGDFVLDNLNADIRSWDATGYRYLKRQSQDNPNVWVDFTGGRVSANSASGNQVAYR